MQDDFVVIKEIENISDGKRIHVLIKIPMIIGWINQMNFIVESNNFHKEYEMKHIKNEDNMVVFECVVDLNTKAKYNYYFSFKVNEETYFYKNNNRIEKTINNNEKYEMSVNFEVPDWTKGKIMYHIFVDRFKRGSKERIPKMPRRTVHESWNEEMIIGPNKEGIWNADYYGGDLLGIIDSLDYIKSLGVSIIYLSPIVWSQSNHRYDTSDYELIDPYVGKNEDLKVLCDKAHEKGMKIILDAVFNHTGNDSKYFNEYNTFPTLGAYQSSKSPYYSFYRKHIHNNKVYFDYWWGMTNLPVCDGASLSWQNYIYGPGGIIDKWFSLGIDGLRLDVADELTDSFIEGIRNAVKRNKPDGFIIGEVWKNPMRMGRSYIESGKGMDSVMNYVLIDALIRYFKYSDVYKLKDVLEQINAEYPKEIINSLMNFSSTHDITRAINIFAKDEFDYYKEWAWDLKNNDYNWCKNVTLTDSEYKEGKEIYKSYIFTLALLPGILSIFYGDEVGLQGMGNLANRKPYPWHNVDNDLLEYFKWIGNIRNRENFLEKADFSVIDVNDKYFMFERLSKEASLLAIINRTNNDTSINIPDLYTNPDQIYSLNNSDFNNIKAYGGLALKRIKK